MSSVNMALKKMFLLYNHLDTSTWDPVMACQMASLDMEHNF